MQDYLSRPLTQRGSLRVVVGAIPCGARASHCRATGGQAFGANEFHKYLLWISTRRPDFIHGFRKRLIGIAPLVSAWLHPSASRAPFSPWGGGGTGGLSKGGGGCCCSPFLHDASSAFLPDCLHPLPCFFRFVHHGLLTIILVKLLGKHLGQGTLDLGLAHMVLSP